jgi:L-lactate dehydrogenase complex protein LldE
MRIALFVTCLNDTLFPKAGQAAVQVLERLGHSVTFPVEQTCCGQMHINSGYEHDVLPLVRRFVSAFAEGEVIVSPSASCAAAVREHYPRLARTAGDDALIAQVDDLVPRVYELCELITGPLGLEDVGAAFAHRVAYHATCHSLRNLKLGDAPLTLLRAVRGIDLVELADAESCCGFGGTFAIKNAETSAAILADKMASLRSARAEICTAVDSSCLMHIGGGLDRLRSGIRTMHVAEILAEGQPAR